MILYWLLRREQRIEAARRAERAAIAAEAKRVADEIREHMTRCKVKPAR